MRARVYRQERIGGYGLDTTGAVMSGPLTVTTAPTANLHASTKQYVDSKLSNITATQFTTGTVPVGRMPAFTGDLTTVAGGTVTTLANSTVTAGTYTKVTVNAKGIVTAGTTLLEADIPGFDWAKITSGKPTTLAGYGITNLVPATGGTLTGDLVINTAPTAVTHIANKAYVDSVAASVTGGIDVGDTIIKTTEITPSGYLRCNGGELSQTTYSALYAVVGDQYSFLHTAGSGKPWKQQYWINQEQSVDITGWTTGTSLPGTLAHSQAIVTKNRVYLLGGFNGSSRLATVYTAPINADGTLGAWTAGPSLPGALGISQAIVTKNRVYLLGGISSTYVATVYTAPINADGTLGAWTTGTNLPGTLAYSQAIVTKNRVYLLGGISASSYVATVYTAPINADGTLGTWTTGTSLPVALGSSQAIVTKNRVYLLGGISGSYLATVYTAPITGGLNDYSSYYDGTYITTAVGNFRLPDYTLTDLPGTITYIKH